MSRVSPLNALPMMSTLVVPVSLMPTLGEGPITRLLAIATSRVPASDTSEPPVFAVTTFPRTSTSWLPAPKSFSSVPWGWIRSFSVTTRLPCIAPVMIAMLSSNPPLPASSRNQLLWISVRNSPFESGTIELPLLAKTVLRTTSPDVADELKIPSPLSRTVNPSKLTRLELHGERVARGRRRHDRLGRRRAADLDARLDTSQLEPVPPGGDGHGLGVGAGADDDPVGRSRGVHGRLDRRVGARARADGAVDGPRGSGHGRHCDAREQCHPCDRPGPHRASSLTGVDGRSSPESGVSRCQIVCGLTS